MKLSEVFSQLAFGELSQLGLASENLGSINAVNYAQIVAHTNMGLSALYKRFPLKEGRVGITLEAGRTLYPLTTNEDVVFIEYDGEFLDDILKIESVVTPDGIALALNDRSNPLSCLTPSAAVLRVPLAIVNKEISVPVTLLVDSLEIGYRASHPIIKYTATMDPDRIEVDLSYSYLEPLLLFIASRVHNPIGMVNEFNAGNNYAAKYEAACKQLEISNVLVDQGSNNTKAERNGWV